MAYNLIGTSDALKVDKTVESKDHKLTEKSVSQLVDVKDYWKAAL
jgi:hypothetical protein